MDRKLLTLNKSELSAEEWEKLSAVLSYRFLKRNELLLTAGELADKVWFIKKGMIRYYQIDANENERTTCFAMENDYVTAFSSYLSATPSHEFLIALEDTQVVEINKSDFSLFLETIPSVNLMYRQVIEGAFLQMERLTYVLQHKNAFERYRQLILEDAPELLQRVPLVYLASYLGISPETLSRIRAKRIPT